MAQLQFSVAMKICRHTSICRQRVTSRKRSYFRVIGTTRKITAELHLIVVVGSAEQRAVLPCGRVIRSMEHIVFGAWTAQSKRE